MLAFAAKPIVTLPEIARFAAGDLVVRDVPSDPAGREALLRAGVDGVGIDTRTIGPGHLFVPLRGSKADGHDFIAAAFERGAACSFCARERYESFRDREPGPLVVVEDVTVALQRLAARYRASWQGLLLGVTGSAGKTTTKDLVAAVLGSAAPTLKTEGNLNNFWGVPLTLLRLRSEHRAGVIEMGMSEPGEIAHLASLAAPNAALITNAGHAHLERFHTVEAIANEKAALARALRPNDVVFAGADSAPLLKALEGVRCRRVTYGLSSEADVRPRTLERLADGTSRLEVEGFPEFTLPLVGAHQAGNALGALAVAKEYGVAPADAVAAIVAYRPAKGRMEVWRVSGATLLVDCYNANPDSTAAALETLANLPGARRRIAILGDMLELGSRAGELHRETGALVQRAELWTVGAFARDWALGAKRAGAEARIFDDVAGVRDALREALAPGVVVLVKGSRGAALERVLEGLELES